MSRATGFDVMTIVWFAVFFGVTALLGYLAYRRRKKAHGKAKG